MKCVQAGGERTVVFEEHPYAASPYGALIVSSKERAVFALAGREVVQRAKSIEVFIRHMQFLSAPALSLPTHRAFCCSRSQSQRIFFISPFNVQP